MQTQARVGWLSIRLTAPDDRHLDATLAAIVTRAHASGLKAATIAQPRGELPVPRQERRPTRQPPGEPPREIALPDGVSGTVTVADDPARLREFVVQVSDLLGPDAAVEIDGNVLDVKRQPVSS